MVRCKRFEGRSFKGENEVFYCAVEKNYTLYINNKFFSEVYLTPQDIFEAILGFLYTHGAIKYPAEIKSIYVEEDDIKVKISRGLSLYTTSFLVKDSLNNLDIDFIKKTLEKVDRELSEIKENCSFHIAKLVAYSGKNFYAYDTSRHILIDKLIGKGLANNIDFRSSFIITTARLSKGIVYKAIVSQIPCMISLRGPISSGIELARKYGLIYISHIRRKGFVIFSGFDKLIWNIGEVNQL